MNGKSAAKVQRPKRKKPQQFDHYVHVTNGDRMMVAAEAIARRCLSNTRAMAYAIEDDIRSFDWDAWVRSALRSDANLADQVLEEVLRIEADCKSRIATEKWPAYQHFA